MIDLEPKYLPDVVVLDEATRESAMLFAPTSYYSREIGPELKNLDAPAAWSLAYRWANEVVGVGDFTVLMEICGQLAGFETMHVLHADAFVRRLADGVLRRKNYVGFVERHIPGCLESAERSWRQVGAWVLYALHDGDTGAAPPSALVPGLKYPAPGRELGDEVMRLTKAVGDEREFIMYLELFATAFSQLDNFIQNRTIDEYVFALAPAITPAYPHGIQPGESYAILTWQNLAHWLGMATVMD